MRKLLFQNPSLVIVSISHVIVYGTFWVVLATPEAHISAVPLAAGLICASTVDFQTFEIPDLASFLIASTGLFVGFFNPNFGAEGLLAALIWGGIFLAISIFYEARRGTIGLGLGDVKLIVGIAIWCGLVGTIYVVFAASLSALVTLLVISKSAQVSPVRNGIAFGPFLCLSAWAVWLFEVGG